MLSFAASAQYVIVNSPANISGQRTFGRPDAWGADLLSDIWTADGVFMVDATAPVNNACEDPTNAAEVSGKIALIDRGGCEFGAKALRAQTAGAIGVVIFNNAPGGSTPGMLAGAVGAQVTIPVVMLSYEDGQTIRTALASGAVNITIGNVPIANNLRITSTGVSNMPSGVWPVDQAEGITEEFIPAVSVINRGSADAADVTAQATITFTPEGGGASSTVYDETATEALILSGDTVIIGFPGFIAIEGKGEYALKYTVTGAAPDDQYVGNDNEVNTKFVYTENIYCKGRWDVANNRPLSTQTITLTEANDREYIVGFDFPNGLGYKLDSLQFFALSSKSFGQNQSRLEAWVYEWNDANNDSIITDDSELIIVGFTPSENIIFADTAATSQWFKVPIIRFDDFETVGYEIPDDNKRYFAGFRNVNSNTTDRMSYGFDGGYDQTVRVSTILATSDTHFPYIGFSGWADNKPTVSTRFRITDFWGSFAGAMYVNQAETSSNEQLPVKVKVAVSPNPSSDKLVVESNLLTATKDITYSILDGYGRVVSTSTKTLNNDYDKASFDVSEFAAGQYYILVKTDNGIRTERFTVQH